MKKIPFPSLFRRRLLLSILVVAAGLTLVGMVMVAAQQSGEQIPAPPPESAMPADLPMDSGLFAAEQLAGSIKLQGPQLGNRLQSLGYALDETGRVQVEIIGPDGERALPQRLVEGIGGQVTNAWRNQTEAWLPVDQLSALARLLPPGYYVKKANVPHSDDVDGEGPAATLSDGYRDHGANCAGLTVAVIDSGFTNLTQARSNGDAPAAGSTTQINYTPSAFESTTEHGTGATETIFDHCPGATYRLYKTDSETDLVTAVNDAVSSGVDVITHSKSYYNTGWTDDSGTPCAAVATASENSILFFTSAGNRALQHWQGSFNSPDGDGWHDWASGDEALSVTFPPGHSGSFHLSWNTAGGTYNFNFYLYDSTLQTVIISSTNTANNFEEFSWTNNTGTTQTVNLAVSRVSGGTTAMEVFLHADTDDVLWEQQHIVSGNSTTSPSNCTNMGLLSVGAVPWGEYGSASPQIADYSSRGPTNSGATRPHLAAPTDTTGFTYPGGFGGTSCATPNAAGTAGAFWSDQDPFFLYVVRELLLKQAQIYKDWGDAGDDNLFGSGGIVLHPFHLNTVWVDRGFGNGAANSGMPYYDLIDAQAAAISGGRAVIVGGNYPELVTLNKALLYESIGGVSALGVP